MRNLLMPVSTAVFTTKVMKLMKQIIFWWNTVRIALYYILLKHFWPFKWKARRGRTSIFYLIFYVLHCTNFWPFRWKAWRGILFFRGWCWGKFKGFRKRPFLSGLYTSFLLQNFPNHFTLNLRSTKMRTKMKMEG